MAARSDAKPNPADPLSNPPSVPEVIWPDEPVLLPNEPPSMPPAGVPTPSSPPIEPDHPLGPHDLIKWSRAAT